MWLIIKIAQPTDVRRDEQVSAPLAFSGAVAAGEDRGRERKRRQRREWQNGSLLVVCVFAVQAAAWWYGHYRARPARARSACSCLGPRLIHA